MGAPDNPAPYPGSNPCQGYSAQPVGEAYPGAVQSQAPYFQGAQPGVQAGWGYQNTNTGVPGYPPMGAYGYAGGMPVQRRSKNTAALVMFIVGLLLSASPVLAFLIISAIPGDHGDGGDGLWWLWVFLVLYALPVGVITVVVSAIVALTSRAVSR